MQLHTDAVQTIENQAAGSMRRVRSDVVQRDRFITYSTLSTAALKGLVVPNYSLGDPVECVLFQRGVNDTYLLTVAGRQFALRVSRAGWRSPDRIATELSALTHLHSKGVGVAMPVARDDGSFITEIQAPEGLRRAVLFEWAKGRTPKYGNAQDAFRYGQLVARLHCASDDMPASNARPRMDLNYLLGEPMERIRTRLLGMPRIWKDLNQLVQRVLARLDRVALKELDWGFCHGDVWSDNARTDGERLTLFDFDSCGTGWRIYDIASYKWEARRQGAEQAAWQSFIDGYLQIRPSAAGSLGIVGWFMILRHLFITSQLLALTSELGTGFVPDESFDELVPFCEKIESEID